MTRTVNRSVDPSKVDASLANLAPQFATAVRRALAECNDAANDFEVKVFEAFRSSARQKWLYEQGRTRPGAIVTHARSSSTSWHGYGLAVDVVHTTRLWNPYGADTRANDRWFHDVGAIFKRHGCNWGGDWTHPDPPHMQWGRCSASPSASTQAMFAAAAGVAGVWARVHASGRVHG